MPRHERDRQAVPDTNRLDRRDAMRAFSRCHRALERALSAREDLDAMLAAGVAAPSRRPTPPAPEQLLPPIEQQEVWAAGVTYFRSRTARMEESKVVVRKPVLRSRLQRRTSRALFQGRGVAGRRAGRPGQDSSRRAMERARAGAGARSFLQPDGFSATRSATT